MPAFRYEARNKQGAVVQGEVEAATRVAATMQLRAADLWITKLEPVATRVVNVHVPGPPRARGQAWYSLFPVRASALRDFFDQLGELLEAGVNIYEAMTVLPGRVHGRLRGVLREISPALARGEPLSEQLARYPYLFSPTTVGLMRAGERSGRLGQMARMLSEQYQLDHRVWIGLLPTRAYGWVIITVATLTFGIPKVLPKVMEASMAHPEASSGWALRQMWLNYVPMLLHELLPFLGLLIVLDWVLRYVLRQPWAAGVRQDFLWYVPGASGYVRSALNVRVLTVMEVMARSGSSYSDALQAAAGAAGPGRLGRQLARAAARTQAGEPLAVALQDVTRLSFVVRSAMLTAEQAGAQEQTLGRLARAEVENMAASPRKLATIGYLTGLLVFGIITGVAVVLGYSGYFQAMLDLGEKMMP
ncbi:MAG TPA: type II secretion system F family protein [Armatimonadota bacterium]|jgi:type II secretory pathway component PulF